MITLIDSTRDARRIPFVTLGSGDSIDIDNLYVFQEIPDLQESKTFCDRKTDNRNIAVFENGVVKDCYKGLPDELNNSLFYTYKLHDQVSENPVSRPVKRIVPLKFFRALRVVLSHLTDTPYRNNIRASLRSRDFPERRKVLEEIDFRDLDVSPDFLKSMAFQLSQANALARGIELYTKADLAEFFPELQPLLYRRQGANKAPLNSHRDMFLDTTEKAYVRRFGDLNLFCFKNGPEVDFRSTRNWNQFITQCRGIIIDGKTERCVHYPFDKFFRIDEIPENREDLLPRVPGTEIVEKIDGSMISCLKYNGQVVLAFKGSFDANSMQKTRDIASQHKLDDLDFHKFSYVFELVSPENLYPNGYSVIDYGERKELVLIGVRDKLTNELLPYSVVEKEAKKRGFSYPIKYPGSLDDALAETKLLGVLTREGYVARFPNGKQVKIKYRSYMDAIKAVNDLKSSLLVERYTQSDTETRQNLHSTLPDAVKKIAQARVQEFWGVYHDIETYLQSIVSQKGNDLQQYALDHVPTGLRKILFRIKRGLHYQESLERVALQYYSKDNGFEAPTPINPNAFLLRYARLNPEDRKRLLESSDDRDRSQIQSFERECARLSDYVHSIVREHNTEFPDYVLENVPGRLRKAVFRNSRGYDYKPQIERIALANVFKFQELSA